MNSNDNNNGWGTGDSGSGVDDNSYEFQGYGDENSQLGAGDTPFGNDLYTDPYGENVYQANWGDNPYTESHANPDPELEL